MKSSDYLRAFKNRDLNREIDFAQAKWKEHDHHTFGDFAKWFENQSPPGCKLTIECMCDPELVKRLENIPLILIDPMWLAATGKAGVNIVTMFEYHRFLFYKDLYAEIGVFGPPSIPSYERAKFLVEAYERSYLNGSPISLAAMCDWLDRRAEPEARELCVLIRMDRVWYNDYKDVDVDMISSRRVATLNGIGPSRTAIFEHFKDAFLEHRS